MFCFVKDEKQTQTEVTVYENILSISSIFHEDCKPERARTISNY